MKKIFLIAAMAALCVSCSTELDEVNNRYEMVSSTTEAEEVKEKSAVPEGDERREGESVEDWLKRLKWKLRNDILGNNR